MYTPASDQGMYQDNKVMFSQLQRGARKRAMRFMRDCWQKELKFKVFDCYRPQERQDVLFCQGRSEETLTKLYHGGFFTKATCKSLITTLKNHANAPYEQIQTWTLESKHTKGLAADIKPINCSYLDIERVAEKYGITRPIPNYPYHFEFHSLSRFYSLLSFLYVRFS